MARSEDDGVVLELLIVGLVEVPSGSLVHVAATAAKVVVGHRHTLFRPPVSAGGCSFWYRSFGNLGVFFRLRIGLTAFFVD